MTRNREIIPATPFLFLTDKTGYAMSWSVPVNLHWINEAINTSDFRYIEGKPKIEVLTPGYYEVIYEVSAYLKSGALNYCYFYMFRNADLIEGSFTFITMDGSEADQHPGSVTCHIYAYFDRGDVLVLIAHPGVGGGTVITIPNTVRMVLKFMPQRGWNNSHGGAVNYRGDVMR